MTRTFRLNQLLREYNKYLKDAPVPAFQMAKVWEDLSKEVLIIRTIDKTREGEKVICHRVSYLSSIHTFCPYTLNVTQYPSELQMNIHKGVGPTLIGTDVVLQIEVEKRMLDDMMEIISKKSCFL